ncbi:MAG: putative ATP-grasp superfamily ATP-dependent carboligase [Nitrospinales bacterium]|jgi:predicted ATP-grasp superfamily ATP-dependent carboligase
MIEELNSLREQFREAGEIALVLSRVTRKIIGFDEEKLQAEVKKTVEEEINRFEKVD